MSSITFLGYFECIDIISETSRIGLNVFLRLSLPLFLHIIDPPSLAEGGGVIKNWPPPTFTESGAVKKISSLHSHKNDPPTYKTVAPPLHTIPWIIVTINNEVEPKYLVLLFCIIGGDMFVSRWIRGSEIGVGRWTN